MVKCLECGKEFKNNNSLSRHIGKHMTQEDYFDKYLKNVEEISDIDKIDYLVMNHNEPDHSGAIEKLAKLDPKITVITSPAGAIYLKNITNDSNL